MTDPGSIPVTHYRTAKVEDVNVFYREAGPASAPVVLLLHGFPTSSHMFRNLIPLLADRYRVIAPTIQASAAATRPITGRSLIRSRTMPTSSMGFSPNWGRTATRCT